MPQTSPARLLRTSAALLATTALYACGTNDLPTSPPTVSEDRGGIPSSDAPGIEVGGVHILRVNPGSERNSFSAQGNAKPGGGPTLTQAGILFHGGSVLLNGPKVVAVYWAAQTIYNGGPTPGTKGPASADGSLIGYFLSHLGGSSSFNVNTTYTDASANPITNAVQYTGFWANNVNAPTDGQTFTNTQILSMLVSGFTSGAITYDPNTIYLVFTAGTANPGGGFGTQYCGYHTYGTATNLPGVKGKSNVIFAALPYDYAYYLTGCTWKTPKVNGVTVDWTPANGDWAADAEVTVLAHEIEESTTDPFLNAWYDSTGDENADKCAWGGGGNFGLTYFVDPVNSYGVANTRIGTKDFFIQMNWVNAVVGGKTGGCQIAWPASIVY